MKTSPYKIYGMQQKRDINSNTGLPQGNSQINNLPYHLKELEKEEQTKSKVSRRKEIIKIKEKINKIEIKKTREKVNKIKGWFFERINKMDKPLARLTKKKENSNKIRNEKGNITTDTAEIQKNCKGIL